MMRNPIRLAALAALLPVVIPGVTPRARGADGNVKLLNVSYDPTRELYQEFNAAFAKQWAAKTGQKLVVTQSHGGSGKQARAIIDGLQADVATLGLAWDVDALHDNGNLIVADWQK